MKIEVKGIIMYDASEWEYNATIHSADEHLADEVTFENPDNQEFIDEHLSIMENLALDDAYKQIEKNFKPKGA